MDKNILQSGETLHLWAFLTDANNIRLNNQEVIFYKIKEGVKTQIGSSVTDSLGIAYFDYIGVGAGKISFGVESGTFSSEIYSVWDTLYFVESIQDLSCSTNVQLSETSEGYYASTPSTTTDNQFVYFNKNGSNFRFPLDKSWCFELDFKTTNAVSFGTHNSTMGNRTLLGITSNRYDVWCNMKIKYDSDTGMVSGFVDDVEDTSRKITVTGTQGLTPRIIDFNKDIDVIFKNVKSYYI